MIRGLYTSGAGMGTELARMDVVANNLVNAGTNGYKKDKIVQTAFLRLLLLQSREDLPGRLPPAWTPLGISNQGAAVVRTVTDFSAGSLEETGKASHLALGNPNCFFVVSSPVPGDPQRVVYTRDGAFTVDDQGYLVTLRGERVLGETGPLFVGDEKFSVSAEGVLSAAGGGELGRLRVAEFADPGVLRKEGNNCFTAPPGTDLQAANPEVRQGFLERANVELAAEMVDMVSCTRAYEAGARVLQAHNDLTGLAINKVGTLK